MVEFTATIKKFGSQGEKTGWTYIDVPSTITEKLLPGQRKSFRVKGKLDSFVFSKLALLPMGNGDFIMTLNAAIRKGIKKPIGAQLRVKMELDKTPLLPPAALMKCLEDEPEAMKYFKNLPQGHQNYFSNWIRSAKTEPTRIKRIAAAVNAFINHQDFGQMLRAMKNKELR